MATSVASAKELMKGLLPGPVLGWLSTHRRARIVTDHSKMSREETVRWLEQSYERIIGAKLNLASPTRFTEKIQWCKLHAMDATKSVLADKYAVRAWVADKIGEEYLIPLLGAWDSPDEIDFPSLPQSFVLKVNNASGTNLIVPDKTKLDVAAAKRQLERWMDLDFGWLCFEPQYLTIPPKIIAEEYICNADGGEPADYKFICFDGKVFFIRIDFDRHGNHARATFDPEWNVQDWCEGLYPRPAILPERPECLDELISLVEKLAKGFSHVRVDFYIVNDRPLFGEMTFSSGAGFEVIVPDEWDAKLGSLWDLKKEPRCELPYGAGVRLWRLR